MLGILKGLLGGAGRVNIERRFSILNETPQGSMSRVYRAIDKENGRTVCLKVQIPDRQSAAMSRAVSAERPSEGEIGMQIVHPNVVRTYEHGLTTNGEQFLAMEFIHGVSLKFVREATNLGLRGRVKVLAQAADGLAAVHAAGFIHHDINPNNFLVDRENNVKLIDFGLAVPNLPAFHRPGNRTGMLQYMAPELIRREPTNEKIDIFSFGVVAYELLTDKLPFGGTGSSMAQMTQKMNSDAIDPALANPRLSEPLCEILRRTLARKAKDRWGTMAKLAEALREVPVKRDGKNDPDGPDTP
ncbi:serine/threonine protein kinase [Tundrisphaera sp. TA3]|uniref:serine/threonine protein kinase n=1 Tax=Tundrisphaera sp. TA3 TaxID=3435775 RepID=UPI003EBD3EB9